MIAREDADWPSALARLRVDPDLRRRLATAARDYVAGQRMFSTQAGRRIAWYLELWDRRAELTEALLDRMGASARTDAAP